MGSKSIGFISNRRDQDRGEIGTFTVRPNPDECSGKRWVEEETRGNE